MARAKHLAAGALKILRTLNRFTVYSLFICKKMCLKSEMELEHMCSGAWHWPRMQALRSIEIPRRFEKMGSNLSSVHSMVSLLRGDPRSIQETCGRLADDHRRTRVETTDE